jgi:branched-chain amino acid transport system ATP-binding protein
LVIAEPLLSIRDLTARYGKVPAIKQLSLEIRNGEVIALLGANGAGKTTLLNTISGFLAPSGGTIELQGEPIGGEAPHRVFRRGIVQVSQARDLFLDMPVADNLALGGATRSDDLRDDLARVFAYFPRLQERKHQQVRTLSGGEQQMVAIGRALMGCPKILMLDEPSGGLAPMFVQEIGNIIRKLRDAGSTMLLVEQNIALALSVADRFYILREGAIVNAGLVAGLDRDPSELARTYYL